MKEPQYKVRPSSRADLKDVFRIFLSPAQLLLHNFHPGDVCHIVTIDQSSTQPAIVWPATEKIKDDVVQTSKALQILYGLKLDSRISIRRGNMETTVAHEVILCEILKNESESESALSYLDEDERSHWAFVLKHQLVKAEVFAPGMTFDRVELNDQLRSFRIHSINSSVDRILYRAERNYEVFVKDSDYEGAIKSLVVSSEGVGGLDKQIETLNDIISPYSHKIDSRVTPSLRARRGGIILHGPSGTGKSMVLGKICEAGWRKVFHIKDRNEAAIRQVFANALACQPSAIIIDNLDVITGRKDPTDLARSVDVKDALSLELDQLDGTQTLAVGVTCSLDRIDQNLRLPGRLDSEIEIPLPDSQSRAEILKVLCELPKDESQSTLEAVAERTNGFSGVHLGKLLHQASKIRDAQFKASEFGDVDPDCWPTETQTLLMFMKDAFNRAIRDMRPKVLHLKIPETKFSDIGGQHEVKKRIQQALAWPAKYPNHMGQVGIKPTKGLLLYGPPGCSKTMTARAVATESGLNFIVVKGAELLSKYVGDTEFAVRELFAKASAARPSVIFFDEFDAMGTARNGSQQEGVHVLTTLLNELDGVQELQDVFVLAATNRPDLIDPALTRPGRFSEALYIGLPDLEARRHILQMQGPLQRSNDLDIVVLSQMTEGYTGAEIAEICQNAGYMAFEEYVESVERGEPDETRVATQQHMITALSNARRPSVTPEMESQYKAWGARIN